MTFTDLVGMSKQFELSLESFVLKFCNGHITNFLSSGGDSYAPYLRFCLKKEPNNDCVFLKNSLCEIHEWKPLLCKFFPFIGPSHDVLEKYSYCEGLGLGRYYEEKFILEEYNQYQSLLIQDFSRNAEKIEILFNSSKEKGMEIIHRQQQIN